MIDLAELFSFSISPLELFVRGTLIYWFIFLILRFIMKRDIGQVGAADVLLLVLIADAAQNGMAVDYRSISDGLVLISTLFFWNWTIDRLSTRFKLFEKFAEPPPVLLVRNGRYLHRNLKRESITVDEVKTQIRKEGIDDVKKVRYVRFESDGTFSVIKR